MPTRGYFLPNAAAFRLTLPTETLFILYIGSAWCYMYSSMKRRVNAKTLRQCLDKLAGDALREKPPLFVLCFPE